MIEILYLEPMIYILNVDIFRLEANRLENESYFTEASADCCQKLSVLLCFTHRIPSQIHLQQLGPVCKHILQALKTQKQIPTIRFFPLPSAYVVNPLKTASKCP